MHERTWHFRLHDKNVIDCASYFGKRASGVAALNCELVASKLHTIEKLRGDGRKIVATTPLENNRENILEFRKDANRLR